MGISGRHLEDDDAIWSADVCTSLIANVHVDVDGVTLVALCADTQLEHADGERASFSVTAHDASEFEFVRPLLEADRPATAFHPGSALGRACAALAEGGQVVLLLLARLEVACEAEVVVLDS